MKRLVLFLAIAVCSAAAQTPQYCPSFGSVGCTIGGQLNVQGSVMPLVRTPSAMGTAAPVTPTITYEDDCAGDSDCLYTELALHHWIDIGAVKVLAINADSANNYSAPVLKIFATYYGHTSIPIGAWQGADVPGGSASSWTGPVTTQFAPGDTKTNYPSCLTTYRTALASAANASVQMVATGFATCLVQLIQSPADSISPLTGAQLVQQKVIALNLMGGEYPSGSESNFQHDPADFNTLFTTWTAQNGYPPIYLLGFQFDNTTSGIPSYFPASNPAEYGSTVVGQNYSYDFDQLALLYAVGHDPAYTLSASGTVVVNPSTGANTWSSSTASGQYYLISTQGPAYYAQILSGLAGYYGAMSYFPASLGGLVGQASAYGRTAAITPLGVFGPSIAAHQVSGDAVNSGSTYQLNSVNAFGSSAWAMNRDIAVGGALPNSGAHGWQWTQNNPSTSDNVESFQLSCWEPAGTLCPVNDPLTIWANGVVQATGIFQETLTTPASSSAACTAGEFTDDANYHYVCTATNTWKRGALTTF